MRSYSLHRVHQVSPLLVWGLLCNTLVSSLMMIPWLCRTRTFKYEWCSASRLEKALVVTLFVAVLIGLLMFSGSLAA